MFISYRSWEIMILIKKRIEIRIRPCARHYSKYIYYLNYHYNLGDRSYYSSHLIEKKTGKQRLNNSLKVTQIVNVQPGFKPKYSDWRIHAFKPLTLLPARFWLGTCQVINNKYSSILINTSVWLLPSFHYFLHVLLH